MPCLAEDSVLHFIVVDLNGAIWHSTRAPQRFDLERRRIGIRHDGDFRRCCITSVGCGGLLEARPCVDVVRYRSARTFTSSNNAVGAPIHAFFQIFDPIVPDIAAEDIAIAPDIESETYAGRIFAVTVA
jgi:hypothetical protein